MDQGQQKIKESEKREKFKAFEKRIPEAKLSQSVESVADRKQFTELGKSLLGLEDDRRELRRAQAFSAPQHGK